MARPRKTATVSWPRPPETEEHKTPWIMPPQHRLIEQAVSHESVHEPARVSSLFRSLGVEVEVVHEPRWSPALMSDDARRILGWAG